MVGFSFRILSSQHRLISSHLNKSKLSSCHWRVNKQIQILFCFNVDGCFLKGRVANWVKPVFPLNGTVSTAVFVYDSKGSITAAQLDLSS